MVSILPANGLISPRKMFGTGARVPLVSRHIRKQSLHMKGLLFVHPELSGWEGHRYLAGIGPQVFKLYKSVCFRCERCCWYPETGNVCVHNSWHLLNSDLVVAFDRSVGTLNLRQHPCPSPCVVDSPLLGSFIKLTTQMLSPWPEVLHLISQPLLSWPSWVILLGPSLQRIGLRTQQPGNVRLIPRGQL